ncbi:MAG: adenosylmethionine decarboxylase [Acidobacteriota bacterium]
MVREALGKHLIAELWVRDPRVLNDSAYLRDCLIAASDKGGFSVLHVSMHAFTPHGVSGVVLLSESHMSIHTWPEYDYAAVDIFTCGGAPREALKELERRLDVEHMDVRELDRGIVGQAEPRPAYFAGYRAVDLS